MRARDRFVPFVLVLAVTGALALACDAIAVRPTFASPDDAGEEAAPRASIPPDGGTSTDAGSTFDGSDEAVQCEESPCAVELVAGSHHFCARMSDGSVRCWGDDSKGATGRSGSAGDASAALSALYGVAGATQISAGGSTTCARDGQGTVLCWGGNESGQLGLTVAPPTLDGDPHPTPAPVAIGAPATRVDVGQTSVCAIVASGDAVCWGGNRYRQLARSSTENIVGPAPAQIEPYRFSDIAIASRTGLARTDEGQLVSWGALRPVSGRKSSLDPDPVPAPLVELDDVTHFAAWTEDRGSIPLGQACAIASGKLYCWGNNERGTICTDLPDSEVRPVEIKIHDAAYPQQVAVSANTTCVRSTDGVVRCCGDNQLGQMGMAIDAGTSKRSLVVISTLKGRAVQVATTDAAVCALLQGGSVACWGGNSAGELGQGSRDSAAHPTPMTVKFQ